MQQTPEKAFACIENGHDWESVGTIDTERVDGKLYGIVLSECLNCGQEITWMSDDWEPEA
jgi:hypothetical protein